MLHYSNPFVNQILLKSRDVELVHFNHEVSYSVMDLPQPHLAHFHLLLVKTKNTTTLQQNFDAVQVLDLLRHSFLMRC